MTTISPNSSSVTTTATIDKSSESKTFLKLKFSKKSALENLKEKISKTDIFSKDEIEQVIGILDKINEIENPIDIQRAFCHLLFYYIHPKFLPSKNCDIGKVLEIEDAIKEILKKYIASDTDIDKFIIKNCEQIKFLYDLDKKTEEIMKKIRQEHNSMIKEINSNEKKLKEKIFKILTKNNNEKIDAMFEKLLEKVTKQKEKIKELNDEAKDVGEEYKKEQIFLKKILEEGI